MKYTGCYSRYEIEQLIPPKGAALICIHDPEPYDPPKVSRHQQGWDRITYHRFWDVDKPNQGYEPASKKDLIWLKEALDKAQDQHCFVSCEAGVSRSAAVREYLLRRGWVYWNGDQERRMVHPNVYIIAELEKLDREHYERINNVA